MLAILSIFIYDCSKKNDEHNIRVNKMASASKAGVNTVRKSNAKGEIHKLAKNILKALKNKDIQELATYIHPEVGLRFSPYTYVDTTRDRKMLPAELIHAHQDSIVLLWGYHDGSGKPINLTLKEYIKNFVYDADFLNAKEVGYQRIIAHGNMKNNSFAMYRDAKIIEFHFPGFEEKYNGMDWKSLKLVFKEFDNRWYLIGIIHDQWTS